MKNVVAYIRVSTDNQCGEDKFGLEAQREAIIDYCKRNDMNILKWYADEGESGAKLRPGFDSIVYSQDVGNPPYEAVVVAKSDRVARDINIYYYYKMMLRKKDMNLISVAEDFGQMGVFASMLEAFTLCCAEMERKNITARTSGGREVKASQGGYSGGRSPYGYTALNHQLVIIPEQAEVVRVIFKLKDRGCKFREICEELNRRGYKTRSGTEWLPSSLQVILNNRKTYEGYYKYGSKQEWVKGQHEPILRDSGSDSDNEQTTE